MGTLTAPMPAPTASSGVSSYPTRSLYARAADPEATLPGGVLLDEIRAELRRVAGALTGLETVDHLVPEAAAWSTTERERYLNLLDSADNDGYRAVLIRRATLGSAPLTLVAGAWLQWLSAPGNADDPVVLRILALYASDLGVGNPQASRGSASLALLRYLTLSERAVPLSRLAGDSRIADHAFYLPAVLLTMSRRPDDFRAEILGADLCLRVVGLLPSLSLVRQVWPNATDWPALDPGGARQSDEPAGVVRARAAVDALLAAGSDPTDSDEGSAARRISLGFRWALGALRRWSEWLFDDLRATRNPAHEMAELLRARAREGAVYHQDFRMGDRPLSQWLHDCRTDPTAFLDVLAASRLVKRGRAEASALISGLVSERGPMFRVFAPEDLAVIQRWIDALPNKALDASAAEALDASAARAPAAEPDPDDRTACPGGVFTLSAAAIDGPDAHDRSPTSLRDAYHLLQRRAGGPELQHYGLTYVRGWLARARYDIEHAENQIPDRWDAAGLRPWLLDQHDRHAVEFDSGAELPSREAIIDSTIQLAPLTLIDGAWLQGFTDYQHASSELGHFLFETYWDELGNGEPHLNHPLIYREVLAEMGVDLPPTGSREFAHSPVLRDRAFELPVYWLCVGRFPGTFLPEILGLNLAMELSGVGGSYRRARIALKKYGFSTRFVDIHNTIDNVATGHSAWAADAVDTYLASVGSRQGAQAQEAVWERVRTGYRSLNPPSGYWARRAERRGRRLGAGS